MVGEDTHISRLGGDVDLDAIHCIDSISTGIAAGEVGIRKELKEFEDETYTSVDL